MNGWNEIERMINEIRQTSSGAVVPEVNDTLEVLSVAEFWKKKRESDRNLLKMRLAEKEDLIAQLKQDKNDLTENLREVDEKFKQASAMSSSIIAEANYKAQITQYTKQKLEDTENVLRNIEQEMLLSEQNRQIGEKGFLDKIKSMQDQQKKLIETLFMRDKTLVTLDKEKQKALRHYSQGMKKMSRQLAYQEKSVFQHREHLKIFVNHVIAQMKDLIAIVSGKMQLASIQYKMTPELKDVVDSIDVNMGQFTSVMDEFVLLTVNPELHQKKTDVNGFIKENMILMGERMRTLDIKYEFHASGDLPEIFIDQELMVDCIMSIIENALEAAAPQGAITITTGMDVERNQVFIKINDSGKVIPSQIISRVFEPYFTTKHNRNGMGLTIAQRIIELHNGIIQIHSGAKSGTTVSILLGF